LDFSGELISYHCDLTNEQDIEAMFGWIKLYYKGVDVCVNSAGVAIENPLLGT